MNNEYFICFGDNESRGESETTLTLLSVQKAVPLWQDSFLGDHSPFCENENIHGFSIVKILYFSRPIMDVFKGNLNFH